MSFCMQELGHNVKNYTKFAIDLTVEDRCHKTRFSIYTHMRNLKGVPTIFVR